MRNLLLSAALIAVPVALFAGYEHWFVAKAAPIMVNAAPLGDLAVFKDIVADIGKIAKTGDLADAKTRAKDLETAWDEAEDKLRPLDQAAWGNIDDAADAVLHAVRAATPDAAAIDTSASTMLAVLESPGGGTMGGVTLVQGIAVTDASGQPLSCEDMLATLRAATAAKASVPAEVGKLQTKATERCNADDDAHADEFSPQALAALAKL